MGEWTEVYGFALFSSCDVTLGRCSNQPTHHFVSVAIIQLIIIIFYYLFDKLQ